MPRDAGSFNLSVFVSVIYARTPKTVFRTKAFKTPMNPAPTTRTDSPGLGLNDRAELSTQATGSDKAACRRNVGLTVKSPSLAYSFVMAILSAKAPLDGNFLAEHTSGLPRKQDSHVPQLMKGLPVTQSPTEKDSTSLPTLSTMPENSCPRIVGGTM
jgi:hypothetical protein